MNEQVASPSPDPAPGDPAEDRNAPVRDVDLRVLEELVDLGMQIARAEARLTLVQVEAETRAAAGQAGPAPAESPQAGIRNAPPRDPLRHDLRFERAARGVRVTIAVRTKLLLDRAAWAARVAKAAAEQARNADREGRTELRRKVGAVLDEVVTATASERAARALVPDINRWFAERDHETQLPNRPVGEIAALIACDFGYKIEWNQWHERPWAAAAQATFPPEAWEPPYKIVHVIVHPPPLDEFGNPIPGAEPPPPEERVFDSYNK